MAKKKKLPPVHPGEVLREDYLIPAGVTGNSGSVCRATTIWKRPRRSSRSASSARFSHASVLRDEARKSAH